MNKLKILIVSIVVLAAVICSSVPAVRADDEQEISKLERKLAVTLNADEVMKYWDSGDNTVLFDAMGPPREYAGYKAIHDHMAEFSGGPTQKWTSWNLK